MENKEKINTVKSYLRGHGYKYSPSNTKWPKGTLIIVEKPRVAICACAEADTQQAYLAIVKRYAAAFFLREEESIEFTMEKLRNCLNGVRLADLNKKAPRKRMRITHYERIERK